MTRGTEMMARRCQMLRPASLLVVVFDDALQAEVAVSVVVEAPE